MTVSLTGCIVKYHDFRTCVIDISMQNAESCAMRSFSKAKAKASNIRGPETIRLR